jgi:predicted SnoaL-like aldol condensation-catalyzing enzyme
MFMPTRLRPVLAMIAAALIIGCAKPAAPTRAPALTANAGMPVPVAAHPDPLAALASPDPALAANKRLVFDLWRTIVDAGHIEKVDDMLAEGYIQHSPVLPTGRAAFKKIFSVVKRRDIPELVEPPLVASIGEGNLVVMSLLEKVAAKDGVPAHVTTHFNLFRIDNGRLAEHWHSVRTPPGPEVLLPENGGPQPVKGAVGAAQEALLRSADARLAANKRVVFDFTRTVVDAAEAGDADKYVAADFIDHSPIGASGLAGVKARFGARPKLPVQPWLRAPVVAIVAEGDMVALVTMRELPHPHHAGRTYTTTTFNMYRLAGDRIVEHWDAAAPGDAPEAVGW